MTKIKAFATLTLVMFFTLSCEKDESNAPETSDCSTSSSASYTITVGAFSLNNGTYTALGNELIFSSIGECQTWTRNASADAHSNSTHLHYNAATNVVFDNSTTTFSYTEYGPEIDQAAIEATCAAGVNGVSKTVNNTTYYQDKPNVYLKITDVVEN